MALSNLAIFSWIFEKICYNREQAEVVERQTRMLQAHVPVGCEGSNPFLRIKSNPINHDRIFSYYGEEGYCIEKLERSGLQLNISLMDSH